MRIIYLKAMSKPEDCKPQNTNSKKSIALILAINMVKRNLRMIRLESNLTYFTPGFAVNLEYLTNNSNALSLKTM